MQMSIRRFLTQRSPLLLLVVAMLLGGAFAASAVAPDAQDTPSGGTCVQDVSDKGLTCTANDVRVAAYYLVEGPTSCSPGDVVRVKLQAELVSGSKSRYDIGLFIAQDGKDAFSGQCYRDYLPPPLDDDLGEYNPGLPPAGDPPVFAGGGPFLTTEDSTDLCGDIEQGRRTFRDVGEKPSDADTGPVWVDVMCRDEVDGDGKPFPDGIAEVGTCVSWDNQKNASPACTEVADTKPGAPSKCVCSYAAIAGLTVVQESAFLELVKRLEPADDPGKFDLLIDGLVASGPDGVGDGGGTGRVEVGAGTSAFPGVWHTVAEAPHPGAGTDLEAYETAFACEERGGTEPFATRTGPGPFSLILMPGDDVVCTFANSAIPAPPDDDLLLISGRKLYVAYEGPYFGTLVGLSGWEITAAPADGGAAIRTTVTDALGRYQFTQQDLGEWAYPGARIEVCEEDRAGWVHLRPRCVAVTFPDPIPADYEGAVIDFANAQKSWWSD